MQKMDLNNEMILMRKDFKNAKVRVVRKLIRHINNLKRKRGVEKQVEQNRKRTEKLGEEISVIQNLVPDQIFKYLLTSNSTLEDLSKQSNVNLQERACVRIGLVPFIRQRMKDLREKVDEFDKVRSNKEEITSLKIVEKLQSKSKSSQLKNSRQAKIINHNKSEKVLKPKNSDLSNDETSNKREKRTSTESRLLLAQDLEKDQVTTSEKASNLSEDSGILSKKNTFKRNSTKSAEQIKSPTKKKRTQLGKLSDEVPQEKCQDKDSNFDYKDSNETEQQNSTLSKFSDDNDSTEDASDNPSEIYSDSGSFEQSDIDSDAEQRDIEVVLPDFYAKDKKKTKTTNYKKSRHLDSNNVSKAKDITEVLSNVGEGYADSDEEEAAVKRRRWANFESDDDDFFITDPGVKFKSKNPALSAQLKRLTDMNPTEVKKSEHSTNPTINRLHDLNPIDIKKEKKEGTSFRPGQNKFFSQFSDLRNRNGLRGWKKEQNFDDEQPPFQSGKKQYRQKPSKREPKRKAVQQRAEKPQEPVAGHLHPSWLASKKKKEQNKIMEFTGKRITFDDSD